MLKGPPKQNARATKRARTSSTALTVPRPMRVNAGRQLFAPQRTCTLRYCDTVSLTLDANGLGQYSFSANGLFDPDLIIAGHQPMGFDQLMTIYGHYTVNWARIKITSQYPRSDVTSINRMVIALANTTTVFTSFEQVMEQQYHSKAVVFYPTQADILPSTSLLYSFKSVYGTALNNATTARGTAAANPSDGQVFACYMTGAASGAVPFLVEIEYNATFSELNNLAQS